MKVFGLFLWNVELNNHTESLWITTKRNCLSTAASKAVKFMQRRPAKFRDVTIKRVTGNGTLDA